VDAIENPLILSKDVRRVFADWHRLHARVAELEDDRAAVTALLAAANTQRDAARAEADRLRAALEDVTSSPVKMETDRYGSWVAFSQTAYDAACAALAESHR
jgi:hypothetical protein